LILQNELALHSKQEIDSYFAHIWQTMLTCIERGLKTEGVLPGPLWVPRRAAALRRLLLSSDTLSNDPRRSSEPRVSWDKVIETMYETGKDMNAKYRETSRGGLAIKIQCD